MGMLRGQGSRYRALGSSLLGALGLWFGCSGEEQILDLRARGDAQVDLAAVVFVGAGETVEGASPLIPLNAEGRFDWVQSGPLGTTAYVLGFRTANLPEMWPDASVLQSVPLEPWRSGQVLLPAPDAAWRGSLESDLLPIDPDAVPPLSASWLTSCAIPESSSLFVDSDCANAPCLLPDEPSAQCNGQITPQVCELLSLDYTFDGMGRWVQAEWETNAAGQGRCTPAEAPNPGAQRMVCPQGPRLCNVDLFLQRQSLGLQVSTLQLLDVPPRLEAKVRPPFAGYLEGPVPASEDQVWVANYAGRFESRACVPDPGRPSVLIRLGMGEELEQRGPLVPGPPCLRLLRAGAEGSFFGAFGGADGRWHWGRFDREGSLEASVPLTATASPSFTPTAAAKVWGRWMVGLSDLRPIAQRASEDGGTGEMPLPSRLVSIDFEAQNPRVGSVELPFQEREAAEVYDLGEGLDETVLVAVDDDDIYRVSAEDLGPPPARFAPSFATTNAVGTLEAEPHALLRLPGPEEALLLLVISGTRYGSRPALKIEGVVHRVEGSLYRSSHHFLGALADPTVALAGTEAPSKVWMGLHLTDRAAISQPGRAPRVLGVLGRFDLDRPGFDPAWIEVGEGPVTGLTQTPDGALWGIMGWTGQVFRAAP